MRVLIVDDDEQFASGIQMMLESEGYEVRSAKDTQEGYGSYLQFKPDLVLTDIHMPGGNGLELMEQIRIHNPMIRTIYMSGDLYDFLSPIEEEKKHYPVSYLEKPFSRVELIGLVSELKAWQPAEAEPGSSATKFETRNKSELQKDSILTFKW